MPVDLVESAAVQDPPKNDGKCSLHEAVAAVATRRAVDSCKPGNGDWDTILLPAGTITLRAPLVLPSPAVGQFLDLRIVGKGYLKTALKGSFSTLDESGQVNVSPRVGVELSNLSIGEPTSRTTRGLFIAAGGDAVMRGVRMINNDAGGVSRGGCILNRGSLYVSDATFIHCKTGFAGGALANVGSAYLEQTTIDGEDPRHNADGTPVDAGRNALHGGGISNAGSLTVAASTLTRLRSTAEGSAISNVTGGSAYLVGVTVAFNIRLPRENESGPAAAIYSVWPDPRYTIQLFGSVVVNNRLGENGPLNGHLDNCTGGVVSQGYNLVGTGPENACPNPAPTDGYVSSRALQVDPDVKAKGKYAPSRAGGVGDVYLTTLAKDGCAWPGCSFVRGRVPSDAEGFCQGLDQRGIVRARSGPCDAGAVQQSQALLIVGDRSKLTAGDRRLAERLTALGYLFLTLSDEDFQEPFLAQRSVTVVADSVDPALLGTKLLDAEGGVLVLDRGLLRPMKMIGGAATDSGTSKDQEKLSTPSPVAMAWNWLGRTGDLTSPKLTTAKKTFQWAKPITTTQWAGYNFATIAGTGNASKIAIFKYGSYDTVGDGFVTPAPRGFFFGGEAATAALNGTGVRYLDEAILATDTY